MSRVKKSVQSRRRRKKILKLAKGYRGARSKLYRTASDAVDRALRYAYRDRRQRKRDFRKLWIVRINAAARLYNLSYSRLMSGLRKGNVILDRKSLADIAILDPVAFGKIAELAAGNL